MTDIVYRERILKIQSLDPRLKRHINHDSRSRRYAFNTAGIKLTSVKHTRTIPVLDQGNLGSCTGNAGVGCLGTEPFASSGRVGTYSLDEAGAVSLYAAATVADDYPGTYPPEDTGSDGLSIAKVLTAAGEISGYQWTFSLDDALKALVVTPFITGTYWYDGMFDPDPFGRVHPTGSVAGGHEYVADELDVENQRIWFTNSWGTSWGEAGRFWMTWDDYGTLLSQQGDVTIFTPADKPAPIPTPPPAPTPVIDPADLALYQAVVDWSKKPGLCGPTSKAKKAVRDWITAKGF